MKVHHSLIHSIDQPPNVSLLISSTLSTAEKLNILTTLKDIKKAFVLSYSLRSFKSNHTIRWLSINKRAKRF